jgi:hypothetical protein
VVTTSTDNKAAAFANPQIIGKRSACIEQCGGDIAEDDSASFANQINCAEADKALASSDVEQYVAVANLSLGKDRVAPPLELREEGPVEVRIAAMPSLEQPLCPMVPNTPTSGRRILHGFATMNRRGLGRGLVGQPRAMIADRSVDDDWAISLSRVNIANLPSKNTSASPLTVRPQSNTSPTYNV